MEIYKENLTAIAQAIREKDGTAEPIVANTFAQRILELPDGHEPVIREGTWWVWDPEARDYVDTGAQAQGPKGDVGEAGLSAYQQAVAGGFTGTEEEFKGLLAQLKDGPFLSLEGGGKISGVDRNIYINPNGNEIVIINENEGSVGSVSTGYFYLINKDGFGASFEPHEDGILFSDGNGGGTLISLLGIKDPERDDAAATKKYVDAQSENAVKKTGELSQTIEGPIVSAPSQQQGLDAAFGIIGRDGSSSEIRSNYIYFDRWNSEKGDDFALSIYAKAREEVEGDGNWHPVLELEDSGFGMGVILTGVNTPTEDYDAANKKYVDEAFASVVGDISALLDAINGEVV